MITALYEALTLKINNQIYKHQVNFMDDHYQVEEKVQFFRASHGLSGPAQNREIIMINGAG